MDNNSDEIEQEETHTPGRREFIKLITAAGAGALVAGSGKNAAAAAGIGGSTQPFSPFKKTHEKIEEMYEISKDYKRMRQKKTASRLLYIRVKNH